MGDLNRWIAPAVPFNGIYLANAAAALPTAPVLDAVLGHLRHEAEMGGLVAATAAAPRLAAGYAAAARLVGGHDDEIAFVESGNRGLAALIASLRLQPGDRVLVDRASWGGTLAMLRSLVEITVETMPVDETGAVDVAATRQLSARGVKLLILTWCPASGGLINPAAALGALAAEIGATYIIDACQAVGQLHVDVAALGCHGLVTSGRKWLRGPRGTALLFASRGFLASTQPFMADQFGAPRRDARRYEQGEAFVAGRLGLAAAIEGALAIGVNSIGAQVAAKAQRLRRGLCALPGVNLLDSGAALSGVVSFALAKRPAAKIAQQLAERKIVVTAVPASYTPLDMAARGLSDVVRAAPHIFTGDDEIDTAIATIAELASV